MNKEVETKLKNLRNMLDEGEKSELVEYSYEKFISELDNKDKADLTDL